METKNTILLIHINEISTIRDFIYVVEDKGFTIVEAEDFNEAYKVIASRTVDIIAVDLDIGYQEAFEFCYRIKHNKNLNRIIILGFTSANERFGIFLDAQTKEEKQWLNIDLLVHKPISSRNIYQLLKREIAILEGVDSTELDSIIDYKA